MISRFARPVAALFAAATLGAAFPAMAETPVKFSLDWKFEGPAAPFLLAKEKGYFAAEGLDVTIDTGAGSVEPINRVASGAYDMGFGDINSVIKFNDQNPTTPLKSIYMFYNKPAFSIVGRKSLGVTAPKDLEGRKLGAPAPDGAYAQWPIFVEANGVPVDDITVLLMADYGVDLYGNTIIVSPAFAEKNPEAVKGFLRALNKAIEETIADPAAAVEYVVAANPVVDTATELERLQMAIDQNIVTDEVKKNGLGAIDPARLAKAIEQIGLTFQFAAKPTAESAFDPAFLPDAAERMVE
jgi:NitT/TauT family transport system substrate-binding protein